MDQEDKKSVRDIAQKVIAGVLLTLIGFIGWFLTDYMETRDRIRALELHTNYQVKELYTRTDGHPH